MNALGCYTQNVMSWLLIAVTAVHVIVCLILILVVLLQSGKAADLAGAFGGMGSQTVFGPRGTATVLSKATTVAAALFMVTSLSLGFWRMVRYGVRAAFWRIALRKHQSKRLPPLPVTLPTQPSALLRQRHRSGSGKEVEFLICVCALRRWRNWQTH